MILIINDFSEIEGGASKVAISQAQDFVNAGKEVIFFSSTSNNSDTSLPINNNNFMHKTFVWKTNFLFSVINMLFNFSAFFNLRKILNTHHIDNIYIHSWSKKLSPSIFLALKEYKFYMFLHDYFLLCPNGGLFNFKENHHCELKPLSINCISTNCDKRNYMHKIFRVCRQFIYKVCIAKCSPKYIFLNSQQKKIINMEGSIIKNKIEVVNITSRHDFEKNHDIFYLGRLDPEKGIDSFINLEFVNKLKINIAGDGMSRNKLESYSNISLKGWLSYGEAIKEAKKNRFAIFTSLWHEVDPLTPWELMALGMPVLSADNNLFGKELKKYFPELVFNYIYEEDIENKVNLLLQEEYFTDLSKKIYNFANNEINARNKNWSKFIKHENMY